ncbi:MAG: DUF6067 family protein [Gemmatimonadota bacterium]
MKRWTRGWPALVWALVSCEPSAPAAQPYAAPALPDTVDGVRFEVGAWEPDLPAGQAGRSRGNHRAVVVVDSAPGGLVRVRIPWRRRDADPERKGVAVVNATDGTPVAHAVLLSADNAAGDVVFEATPGATTYHVYYLPWETNGGYYPRVTYLQRWGEPDPAWERRARAEADELPRAQVTALQSVDEFHSFFPMEVIATPGEAAAFLAAQGGWAVVPEHRDRPIRMRRFLPLHWVRQGPAETFASAALRNESFVFQLGLVAGEDALTGVQVEFAGFPPAWMERLTCFNCGGVDENGRPFSKSVDVPAGEVQPLWLGLRVPDDTPPGRVSGRVRVSAAGGRGKEIAVAIDVRDGQLADHGDAHPERMGRLAWLNSTAGTDPDFIIAPFEPVAVTGRRLSILGRAVELGADGLPEQLLSFFGPDLTSLVETPSPVLVEPVRLEVRVAGAPLRLDPEPFEVSQVARGRATWAATSRSEAMEMRVEGALEYDGMLDYRITVRARADLDVEDIHLPLALQPDAATWMLGLGRRGGRRPERLDWRWAVENHQEGLWLGGMQKGLQYVLRDDHYVRPLNTNFYQNQPLRLPESWVNGGKGGIHLRTEPGVVRVDNTSGARHLVAGDSLQFNVRFLLTPFKPLDPARHFRTRFVHKYVPVDSVRAWGGTVVNIHHANEINPYINYPFFNLAAQSAYIEEAHAKGIRVKLYDTIRELTYKAWELFALRSLGDEILNDGEGGGHSWLQEHLEDDYHAGWHAWSVDDAAVLDKGTSRWTNYYIEGLSWLAANQQIDGLYLDDIAFSRETVKRIVSVLHAERDTVIIDLHSANQFNPRDGWINSAMLYMEHFPYISRLWFGEYFEYERDEDYWITEVSGLPFGLMGEMLQDGGHPYRGLLYGMTARLYGDVDPRPVWRMMDDFGIDGSRMRGYWMEDAPVRTDHPRVLATTYERPEGLLVVLASWADRDVDVALSLDRDLSARFGAQPSWAPAVLGLQDEAEVALSQVRVPAGQGRFIRIGPRPPR